LIEYSDKQQVDRAGKKGKKEGGDAATYTCVRGKGNELLLLL
jgi:hypothetical protein